MSRNRQTGKKADGKSEKYTKKYALSSMCECGFCGTKLTRFDDVIDSVVGVIEDISTNNEDIGRLKKEQKALENLEQRRKKLTDLYLDEGIFKEAYDKKYEDLSIKILKSKENIEILGV